MPPCEASSSTTISSAADLKDLLSGLSAESKPNTNASSSNTNTNKKRTTKDEDDPVLKWMYILVCYLCITMTIWIMFIPGSWLISRSKWHREVMLPYIESIGGFRVTPAALVTKYQEHTLVQFTHIIPAGIWAGIIPFQLHPTWRNRHRQLHRVLGYVFVSTTLPIACGILIILDRKLSYHHSFPDDLPPQSILTDAGFLPSLAGLASWFAGTAIYAVYLARTKQYNRHKIWMVRHIAAGIWVAAQRFICLPVAINVLKVTHPPPDPIPLWLQREVFGGTGTAACAMSLVLGEYAVHRITTNISIRCKAAAVLASAARNKKGI